VLAGTASARTLSETAVGPAIRVANPVPASQLVRCRCQ
jgi:hypothetical protein